MSSLERVPDKRVLGLERPRCIRIHFHVQECDNHSELMNNNKAFQNYGHMWE